MHAFQPQGAAWAVLRKSYTYDTFLTHIRQQPSGRLTVTKCEED